MKWKLKLDLWESEAYNNNIRPVITDIAMKMDEMVGSPPVLGYKQLWIINDPYYGMRIYTPLSDECYKLGLTVGHLTYGKIAYQFAHLLSTIYTDPRQPTWFSVVLAHMASFWFLDWLAGKWLDDHPSGEHKDTYLSFSDLRTEKVKTAYQNVDIMLNLASDEWVKEEVTILEHNNDPVPPVLYDQIALELLPFFREEENWKLMPYIGSGTKTPIENPADLRFRPRAKPDFKNLLDSVPVELKPLVQRIKAKLYM